MSNDATRLPSEDELAVELHGPESNVRARTRRKAAEVVSDVLVVTAPVPGAYPTFNTMWASAARYGKKTPEYTALFDAVKTAAQNEMARTGWKTAAYYCAFSVTVYRNTHREIDPTNLAKCESDSLVAAGVIADDKLFRPFLADTEFDPSAESRVVIVVRRRFPDLHGAPVAIVKTKRTSKAPVATSGLMGEVNGVPVPREQMLADLRKRGRL